MKAWMDHVMVQCIHLEIEKLHYKKGNFFLFSSDRSVTLHSFVKKQFS